MVNVLEKRDFQKAWAIVGEGLIIKTEADYKKAVDILDSLLDTVGDNAKHPLFGFLEVLGTIVESYERDYVKIKASSPQEVLSLLMEEHGLTQSDIPEIGSQGVVSEILHGKREMNARQIKAASERFQVSPEVFF